MAAQALSTVATPTSKCISHRVPSSYLRTPTTNPLNLHSQWVGTPIKISFHSNNFKPFVTKHCPVKATLSFNLPSANPETAVSNEKIPKWSSKAIQAFAMAELQAHRMHITTTGTEALLVGISVGGTNFASKYLRANNITLFKIHDEITKVLGESDSFVRCPTNPPLTEDAQKALDWALNEKLKSGDNGEVTTAHMLLGVWAQKGSLGHKVLSALGFNDEKAQELMNLISQPGFVED